MHKNTNDTNEELGAGNSPAAAPTQTAPEPPDAKPPKPWWRKRKTMYITGAFVVVIVCGMVIFGLVKNDRDSYRDTDFTYSDQGERQISDSEAVKAGKQLAGGKCEGSGPVKLSSSPMKSEDIAMIIPYGLVVDGHVTPIDHQYFSPAVFNSAPNTYEVRALADGRITEISHRGETVGNKGKASNDYRFVFAHSCTFLTYFDLVTGLAPDIKAEYDKTVKTNGSSSYAQLDIKVKAGQLVGYIGGQTLDFAVWDTEKPLSGFITPSLYDGERWKLYTADPLEYYTDDVKQLVLSKYLRSGVGKSGRIDWDVDGKLIGNWFAEGTNGYEGDRGQGDGRYWRGHLSVAPDHLDPGFYVASFGTFAVSSDGEQFFIKSAQPDPKDVEIATGLVKYELVQGSYMAGGKMWDRKSTAKDIKISVNGLGAKGCVLFQLLENRKLRAEPFPGKACAAVTGFTAAAKTYVR